MRPLRGAGQAGRTGPVGLLLLLGALAAGAFVGWQKAGPPDLSRWDEAIDRAAARTGLDRALLASMVAAESGGKADATSRAGARGLLQVLPATALEEAGRLGLDTRDENALFEPATNLLIGASFMARLLRRYDGDEVFALAAYNAGPTVVDRWRRRMPQASPMEVILAEGYEETRRHVARVLAWKPAYTR